MTDPKVVHPATENRIDFRNHDFDGPADMLSEDLPELFKQRCPLLQLGRVVGPLQLLCMTLSPCCPYQPRRSVSPHQSLRRSMLPSPKNGRLGLRALSFRGHMGLLALRPGDSLTILFRWLCQ